MEDGISYDEYNTFKEYGHSYNRLGLPDLMGVIDKDDLLPLKYAIIELDNKFKRLLVDGGLELKIFEGIDGFIEIYGG